MERSIRVAFILDHPLMEYRIPFFDKLGENGLKVTVCHVGKKQDKFEYAEEIVVKNRRFFTWEYRSLPDLDHFQIVVHMQNIWIINLWGMIFNPFKKYKLIGWGIGASASRGLSLRKNPLTRTRDLLAYFMDALILYSPYPLPLYSKLNRKKIFVANNTIHNPYPVNFCQNNKNSFLFIGSLKPRKGIEVLVEVFIDYLKTHSPKRVEQLVIIGDGELKDKLQDLAERSGFKKSIVFAGRVIDLEGKKKYFQDAVVSISPYQAGLSILDSFSYGVPFISFEQPISGGEHLNITHQKTGYFVKSKEDLLDKMIELDMDVEKGIVLGHNAYLHYTRNRTITNMVNVFREAFDYAMKE